MEYDCASPRLMMDVHVKHKVMHVDKRNYKHKQAKIRHISTKSCMSAQSQHTLPLHTVHQDVTRVTVETQANCNTSHSHSHSYRFCLTPCAEMPDNRGGVGIVSCCLLALLDYSHMTQHTTLWTIFQMHWLRNLFNAETINVVYCNEQDRQCAYNVTVRGVRATNVPVEEQYYTFRVCLRP
jgi:hypothetical protein